LSRTRCFFLKKCFYDYRELLVTVGGRGAWMQELFSTAAATPCMQLQVCPIVQAVSLPKAPIIDSNRLQSMKSLSSTQGCVHVQLRMGRG
jgi:hypothetical protein